MILNLFNKKKNLVEVMTDNLDIFNNSNDYKFIFNETTNTSVNCQTISFGNLTNSNSSVTLTIYKKDKPEIKLDFKYSYSCFNKQEAIKFQNFVAVGVSGFLYLYDLSTKNIVLFIDFNGYFDEFKICQEHLLVAYNSGIYCITQYGQIKWHNNNVGLDGININKIENGRIFGSAQINPPDGWIDFILDLETGKQER